MQAWSVAELGAPERVMVQRDIQLPEPGDGELRIAVSVAALGLPDVMMCRGEYEYKPPLPFTPGQEVAGEVIDVGEGVSLHPGQRVMGVTSFFNGQGGFAEHCMSMEGMVYPVPDAMPDDEAAAFTIAYHTAWIALVCRGQLANGETLLVLGAAGGSGSAAVQLGKALGARVIAVAGGAAKAAQCRLYGADEVIDHTVTKISDAVNFFTDGVGANVVFDPVGGAVAAEVVQCTANEGRLLAVGFASGDWAGVDSQQLALRNRSLLGVFVGAYTADQRHKVHSELVAFYQRGLIKPPIEQRLEFDAIPAALGALHRREIMGKQVASVGRLTGSNVLEK